ncbi:GyrI-like domain-containing protein [Marinoscillum sp. MHG1-6]|uniref:SRPBCC family protein n=1 Tax=Marinoscillum sp. MHG1-6 TaxID=2959627 RepID=UPI0021577F3B|nr:GyrI-like domain-containing protein [Marinoscillum sp. MHG1-6]
MKLLKVIGIAFVALVLLVFVMVLALPDETHISRSVVIDATPGEVYRELVTFKNFNDWSPWAARDTATVYTYEGPELGVGTKMTWVSESDDVGSGSMEIIEIKPDALVKTLMKFEGFDSSPTASYIIESSDGGTQLTWTYDELGVSGIGKLFGLMMDNLLGPDYEAGLQSFKERLESAPEATSDISLTSVEGFDYIGISSTVDPALISSVMAQSYGTLFGYTNLNGVEMAGYPIAVYSDYSENSTSFICGLPVSDATEALPETIDRYSMPSTTAVKYLYKGDYSGLESAYKELGDYIAFADYEITGDPWEEYLTDPESDPDTANWVTHVYFPVK